MTIDPGAARHPRRAQAMNPLTPDDLPILSDLIFEAQSAEGKALILRLEEAAKGSTGVEIVTAGTEARRIMDQQRQTIIEQQTTIATERASRDRALADLRHATRPRREWLTRSLLARAWDQGFQAGYADGAETGPTEPPNPYRRKP